MATDPEPTEGKLSHLHATERGLDALPLQVGKAGDSLGHGLLLHGVHA